MNETLRKTQRQTKTLQGKGRAGIKPEHADCLLPRIELIREIHRRIFPDDYKTSKHREFFSTFDPWLMALYRRGRNDMMAVASPMGLATHPDGDDDGDDEDTGNDN